MKHTWMKNDRRNSSFSNRMEVSSSKALRKRMIDS